MDRLLEACEKKFDADKIELMKKAIDFAKKVHAEQKRESGEPYYIHPEAVAMILLNMQMDADTVIAGLLHDTVEDGKDVTVAMISDMFGEQIAKMVDGVTKLTKSNLSHMLSKEDRQAENLRKMFLSIASDVRVVIIKLADRLHNMRTLNYCQKEKRARKAKETLDVYAPLADRFGMGAIKVELEDIAFSYLMPEECKRLQALIEPKQKERLLLLESAKQKINESLASEGIKADISGRRKHIYSIYRKLTLKKYSLNEIYDLVALRVIVNSVSDCYAVLGIIHQLWKPMPGRVKDYIAMPKTNMYRSLHTTLFSEHGMPFEVQIRTWEMHRTAEYGIAAHWMYKEGKTSQQDIEGNLAWLRQLVDYDSEADSTREYVANVRRDFFSDYIFALTPKGDIIDLPAGSTPIDFAYRIHTNVGNHVHHALVDNNMVKLDYKLKTNDVVTIVTSPQSEPSRNWLSFVKTSQARSKIKQWFKKANRSDNIIKGREMLADAARRQGYKLADIVKPEYSKPAVEKLNMTELDDAYAAIGYGGITVSQLLNKLLNAYCEERKKDELVKKTETGDSPPLKPEDKEVRSSDADGRTVIVKGDAGVVVRFSRCCNPVPGNEIFGYVTRGRGISIHSKNCTNAPALLLDADRIVEVRWADNEGDAQFPVTVKVISHERVGLLMALSQTLMGMNLNLKGLNAKAIDNDTKVEVTMSFNVRDAHHLETVMENFRKIDSVISVSRSDSL